MMIRIIGALALVALASGTALYEVSFNTDLSNLDKWTEDKNPSSTTFGIDRDNTYRDDGSLFIESPASSDSNLLSKLARTDFVGAESLQTAPYYVWYIYPQTKDKVNCGFEIDGPADDLFARVQVGDAGNFTLLTETNTAELGEVVLDEWTLVEVLIKFDGDADSDNANTVTLWVAGELLAENIAIYDDATAATTVNSLEFQHNADNFDPVRSGFDEFSINTVDVPGPPDEPHLDPISEQNKDLTLRFHAGANGGMPITKYNVYDADDGDKRLWSGEARLVKEYDEDSGELTAKYFAVTLDSGLDFGTYNLILSAENELGEGTRTDKFSVNHRVVSWVTIVLLVLLISGLVGVAGFFGYKYYTEGQVPSVPEGWKPRSPMATPSSSANPYTPSSSGARAAPPAGTGGSHGSRGSKRGSHRGSKREGGSHGSRASRGSKRKQRDSVENIV